MKYHNPRHTNEIYLWFNNQYQCITTQPEIKFVPFDLQLTQFLTNNESQWVIKYRTNI